MTNNYETVGKTMKNKQLRMKWVNRPPKRFNPAMIPYYLYAWETARSKWIRDTLPEMRQEAVRRGQDLETEMKVEKVRGIPVGWEFVCRFKRPRKLPKTKRPLCGARCRNGQPCKMRVVLGADGKARRRCRLHGGLSTGPRTPEGRAAIAASNRRRARPIN